MSVWVFQDHTYIYRWSSCQFEFFETTSISVDDLPCSVWVWATPISIGHVLITFRVNLSRGCTYIDRPCSYHFSCQFESGSHLYRSTMFLSLFVSVWVGVAPISIDHVPIIFCVSLSFRGRTYIDQPSSYHFHVSLSFSRLHLHRLAIFLSFPCQFEFFGTAPISIGHLSCSVWVGVAPISIDHVPIIFHVSLSRGCTYIDWPCSYHFSCQFESGLHLYRSTMFLSLFVSVWVEAAPISIDHVPIIHRVTLSRGRTYIDRPCSYHFSCQFESRSHLYRSTMFLSFFVSVWVFGITSISIGHLPIISTSVWVF